MTMFPEMELGIAVLRVATFQHRRSRFKAIECTKFVCGWRSARDRADGGAYDAPTNPPSRLGRGKDPPPRRSSSPDVGYRSTPLPLDMWTV